MKRLMLIALAAFPLAACETSDSGYATQLPSYPPQYGSVNDIADFVGAKGGQAEMGLENRGYQLARTQGLTAFWWNGGTQACARIVTADGRYQSITAAPRTDCLR